MPLGGGVVVPISADTSGLTRGLGKAQSSLRRFGKIAAIAAGAAAVGGLVKTLEIGTQKFIAQEKAVAQTNARLKSTGAVANVTAKDIVALSDAIADKTGVDDDQIHAVENMLLTFTKIRNEVGKNNDIFNQATTTVVDLSIAFEKDLNSSAIMLGKALNDPVKGITALSRAGVQFTEGQKKTIKSLVESGKFLEAQKMILKELETQVGGSGEAFGQTLPGQLSRAKQSFEVIAQTLAATFLPGIADAARKVTDFLNRFAAAPTLRAKAEIIIGGIVDRVKGTFKDLITWWTATQRTELPARVIITPSGRQQFDTFFQGIEKSAYEFGRRAGRGTAQFFLGLFSSEGRAKAGGTIKSVIDAIGEAGLVLFRVTGVTFLQQLVKGFSDGAIDLFSEALRNMVTGAIDKVTPSFTNLGDRARGAVLKAFGRKGGNTGLANVMTQTIRDAVQSARGALAGAAGTLGGMVGQIITGTSPEAKRAREIRAQQKAELAQREETRLRNAVAQAETDEERKAAEQDLQDFILEQEAQRLEESAQAQAEKANNDIANLTESFNRGEISAQQFSDALNGIIGANRGAELGAAFAGAFERELQGILNIAKDIASVVGQAQPISAVSGGGVGEALRSENERRFREALGRWEKRRKERRDQAVNFRKRPGSDKGSTITAAEEEEIRNIMKAWDKENRKPERADYGLALGGILKQPTFVAGEAGKEAVIPLESGSAMRILRDAIGGGGGSTQVINLTVNAGLGTNPDELSQVIVNSIKRYEKRNGAVFQGPIVSVAANAAGQTSTDSGATTFNRIRSLRSG